MQCFRTTGRVRRDFPPTIPHITCTPSEIHEALAQLTVGYPVFRVSDNGTVVRRSLVLDRFHESLTYSPSRKLLENRQLSVRSIVRISFERDETRQLVELTDGDWQSREAVTIRTSSGQSLTFLASGHHARLIAEALGFLVRRANPSDDESTLRMQVIDEWLKARRTTGDDLLPFPSFVKAARRLELRYPRAVLRELFTEVAVRELPEALTHASDDFRGISFYVFRSLVDRLAHRRQLAPLFLKFAVSEADAPAVMTGTELQTFLWEAQRERVSDALARGIIRSVGIDCPYLNFAEFCRLLTSPKLNSWCRPEELSVCSDMNRPLHHYFIRASHNTAVQGTQLEGTVAAFPVVAALEAGARCIELEVGSVMDSPVITRAYSQAFVEGTDTPKRTRQILEAIRDTAFRRTDFPLMILVECHAPASAFKKFAESLIEVLGDQLHVVNRDLGNLIHEAVEAHARSASMSLNMFGPSVSNEHLTTRPHADESRRKDYIKRQRKELDKIMLPLTIRALAAEIEKDTNIAASPSAGSPASPKRASIAAHQSTDLESLPRYQQIRRIAHLVAFEALRRATLAKRRLVEVERALREKVHQCASAAERAHFAALPDEAADARRRRQDAIREAAEAVAATKREERLDELRVQCGMQPKNKTLDELNASQQEAVAATRAELDMQREHEKRMRERRTMSIEEVTALDAREVIRESAVLGDKCIAHYNDATKQFGAALGYALAANGLRDRFAEAGLTVGEVISTRYALDQRIPDEITGLPHKMHHGDEHSHPYFPAIPDFRPKRRDDSDDDDGASAAGSVQFGRARDAKADKKAAERRAAERRFEEEQTTRATEVLKDIATVYLQVWRCEELVRVMQQRLEMAHRVLADALAAENVSRVTPQSLRGRILVAYKHDGHAPEVRKRTRWTPELHANRQATFEEDSAGDSDLTAKTSFSLIDATESPIVAVGVDVERRRHALMQSLRSGKAPYQPFDAQCVLPRSLYSMPYYDLKADGLSQRDRMLAAHREILARVYPENEDSSNIDWQAAFATGTSIVSMNYQTWDEKQRLYDAFFDCNGGCGYILKPEYMCDATKLPGNQPFLLRVRLLFATQLPRPSAVDDMEQYSRRARYKVEVTVSTPPETPARLDKAGPAISAVSTQQSQAQEDETGAPSWNETFEFRAPRVGLSMIAIRVLDHEGAANSRDTELAEAALPLFALRQGYRAVPLRHAGSGQALKYSSLLCHFEFVRTTNEADEIQEDAAPRVSRRDKQAARAAARKALTPRATQPPKPVLVSSATAPAAPASRRVQFGDESPPPGSPDAFAGSALVVLNPADSKPAAPVPENPATSTTQDTAATAANPTMSSSQRPPSLDVMMISASPAASPNTDDDFVAREITPSGQKRRAPIRRKKKAEDTG